MGITSNVMVQDPVDIHDLFAAACEVVGLSVASSDWHLFSSGGANMFQTRPGQGAAAGVSVHFTAGGGRYPGDDEGGQPDGYALVMFDTTASDDSEDDRARHQRIIDALGAWLTGRGLRWSWQYEEELWVAGYFLR